jgi:hypothetical protein
MNITLDLTQAPIINNTVKQCVQEVEIACKNSPAPISPQGFTIDSSLCDWHHISTEKVSTLITETAALFGSYHSNIYSNIVEFMCEQLNEYFSK